MNHPKKTRQNFKNLNFYLIFPPLKLLFRLNNFLFIFLQKMTEEIQEKKNTVATVGMRFSII